MTDGAAEPNGTAGCIVPAVAGTAAQITTPAAHSVTNTRAWFGKYEQWTRGHGAASQLVQGAWTGASTYGTNTIDWVGALSVCEGGCVEAPLHEEIDAWLRVAMEVLGKYANLKTPPPVDSPETGWLNGEIFVIGTLRTASVVNGVRQATGRLATIHQHVAKDRPTILRPSYTSSELTTLAKLKGSATFSGSLTFTPAHGKPVSVSLRFKLKPAGPEAAATPTPRPGGTITSVQFFGSAANPSVVVQGKNLGAKPAPDPAFHPSGQSGCPSVTGDSGYDYGTSLYLANTTKNWAAGRSRPSLGELDCLDLVVTKFTSSEVAFHFGPFYAQYEKAKLDAGDAVQIVVNDASKTATAKYSAAASG